MTRHPTTLITLAAAVLLAACSGEPPPEAGGMAAQAPRPVRAVQVQPIGTEDRLVLPGEVRPRLEHRYGFRVGGKISRRLVDVGQAVTAGQVLAVLDAADVTPAIAAQQAQVEAQQADAALQRAELGRQQRLRDQGFLSNAALERQQTLADAAEARLAAERAALAQARNGLNFQTLRSDRAGIVTAVEAEVGSVVAAGQTVVRVAPTGSNDLLVAVPERAVNALRSAVAMRATLDAVPGRAFELTLRELAPSADPSTRTYAARLAFAEPDPAVRWGMSATVRIALGEAPAIVVPLSALHTRDATPRVWVVDTATRRVQPVPVTLGDGRDDGVIVRSGLRGGEWVVTAGASLLQPGQAVRLPDAVTPSAPPAPSAASATPPPRTAP
jgi:RND family efflux transporter MFP subunit